jgi:hypothetical protein
MDGLADFVYAKKAWIGAIITAVGEVVILVRVVTADKAITFDEAEGVFVAVVAAVTTIGVLLGVFKASNGPRTPVP